MYGNYYQPPAYSMPLANQQQMGFGQYQQPVNGLVRVTGYEGARAYAAKMPPNSNMPVFDGDCDTFYIIMTDGAGFPTINTYDFIPHQVTVEAQPETSGYVTREEFEELKKMITGGAQNAE